MGDVERSEGKSEHDRPSESGRRAWAWWGLSRCSRWERRSHCCDHGLLESTPRRGQMRESPPHQPSPGTPHTLLLASVQTQEMPVETFPPAIRLIDREVKLPSVQCRELMGFCFPGQIPRLLLVPELSACGVYEKKVTAVNSQHII